MGVTPVWRHNDSLVTNSPPTSGTSGIYVREPANQERVLVLQIVTQSVVGTYVCLEGTSPAADSATFVITTGKAIVIGCVSIGVKLLWLCHVITGTPRASLYWF